jgi:hypothetical protein
METLMKKKKPEITEPVEPALRTALTLADEIYLTLEVPVMDADVFLNLPPDEQTVESLSPSHDRRHVQRG